MLATLDRFLRDESGITAVEYGLIVALAAVAVVAALASLNGELGSVLGGLAGGTDTPGVTEGGD